MMAAFTILILALAVAAVSVTVTRASATKGLRELALRHVPPLGRLISCPYCFSHWAAFAAVMACPLQLVPSGAFVNTVVAIFSVVGLAALIMGAIMHLLHVNQDIIDRLEADLDRLRDALTAIANGD